LASNLLLCLRIQARVLHDGLFQQLRVVQILLQEQLAELLLQHRGQRVNLRCRRDRGLLGVGASGTRSRRRRNHGRHIRLNGAARTARLRVLRIDRERRRQRMIANAAARAIRVEVLRRRDRRRGRYAIEIGRRILTIATAMVTSVVVIGRVRWASSYCHNIATTTTVIIAKIIVVVAGGIGIGGRGRGRGGGGLSVCGRALRICGA
jgi:hypothetical protein